MSKTPSYRLGKDHTYITAECAEGGNFLELHVATPVWSLSDPIKKLGVLVNCYSAGVLSRVLSGDYVLDLGAITQCVGIGKTGHTYLVNKEGTMITSTPLEPNGAFRQKVNTYPVQMGFGANPQEVQGAWKDYRDAPVFGASMRFPFPAPGMDWILITEQHQTEALLPLSILRRRFIQTGTVSLVLVILLACLTAKAITDPIAAITKATREISAGHFSTNVEGIHRKDEIGILAQSFNSMSRDLTSAISEITQKNEDLGKANDSLRRMTRFVSHEIRNPLSVIDAHLAMLLDGPVWRTHARAGKESTHCT